MDDNIISNNDISMSDSCMIMCVGWRGITDGIRVITNGIMCVVCICIYVDLSRETMRSDRRIVDRRTAWKGRETKRGYERIVEIMGVYGR